MRTAILIFSFSLFFLCLSGCSRNKADDWDPADPEQAIAFAKAAVAKAAGEPDAQCHDCDAFHLDPPKITVWRVNGKIDLLLSGKNQPPTERPFKAELQWDGKTFHEVWVAVGRQEIERHER
jgi:hypothetical protein